MWISHKTLKVLRFYQNNTYLLMNVSVFKHLLYFVSSVTDSALLINLIINSDVFYFLFYATYTSYKNKCCSC